MNVNSSFAGGTKLLPVILFLFITSFLFANSGSYIGLFEFQLKSVCDTLPYSKVEKDTVSVSGDDENKIHTFVEEQPEFPGDIKTLLKWTASHIIYPTEARRKGIQGTIYVKFVIEKDGSVSSPEVVKRSEKTQELEEEALRVVSTMPTWIPGKHKGKPVRVFFTIPLNFRLY
jgi:protein TonB